MEAALACYCQGKFSDAATHGHRAVEVDPAYLLARFNACKFLAADGHGVEAARNLEPVIRADRYYSVSTADDPDLAPKQEVRALLEQLRKDSATQLTSEIRQIEGRRVPFYADGGEQHHQVRHINVALHDGRYLRLLGALDEIPTLKFQADLWQYTLQS
jgi:hypothetical protein